MVFLFPFFSLFCFRNLRFSYSRRFAYHLEKLIVEISQRIEMESLRKCLKFGIYTSVLIPTNILEKNIFPFF